MRTGVDETKRRPMIDDILAREAPGSIDGYVAATVLKYSGRGVSTESGGRLRSPRLNHQRVAKNVMVIPATMPPRTPPAIAPALIEASVLGGICD